MDDFDTPKIWFVRHAESEANVRRIYANTGCSFPLTAIGLQQAMAVSIPAFLCTDSRHLYKPPSTRNANCRTDLQDQENGNASRTRTKRILHGNLRGYQ